jgi:hypothetical protein
MNKVNILSIVFAGICAFSACTDDKDPVINDLKDSEGNNISFTLNAPNNSSYTLMPENASSIIDIFTCEQPDYGFAAGIPYKSVKEELNSRNSSRCRLPVPAKKS